MGLLVLGFGLLDCMPLLFLIEGEENELTQSILSGIAFEPWPSHEGAALCYEELWTD